VDLPVVGGGVARDPEVRRVGNLVDVGVEVSDPGRVRAAAVSEDAVVIPVGRQLSIADISPVVVRRVGPHVQQRVDRLLRLALYVDPCVQVMRGIPLRGAADGSVHPGLEVVRACGLVAQGALRVLRPLQRLIDDVGRRRRFVRPSERGEGPERDEADENKRGGRSAHR
jgi:hypothetical protein